MPRHQPQHDFIDHHDTCAECRVPTRNPKGIGKDKPFDGCDEGRRLFELWRSGK